MDAEKRPTIGERVCLTDQHPCPGDVGRVVEHLDFDGVPIFRIEVEPGCQRSVFHGFEWVYA